MSKTVAILTFHFHYNYGGVLQAYALAETVKTLGYSPVFPDYIPPYFRNQVSALRGWGISRRDVVGNVISRMKVVRRRRAFDVFRRRHLPLSGACRSPERLCSLKENYRAMLVGSDQVWNLQWMESFDSYYFLGFLPTDGSPTPRRISYAPSFGQGDQDPARLALAGKLLSQFHAVSVRDEVSRKLVRDTGVEEVEVVVDPTMLHDFNGIGEKREIDGAYILVYAIDKGGISMAKDLALGLKKKNGARIVLVLSEYSFPARWADLVLSRVGPSEWISLIRHAAFIVTDSFHGAVFASKFDKAFVSYSSGWRAMRLKAFHHRYLMEDRLCLDEVEAGDHSRAMKPLSIQTRLLFEEDARRSKAFLTQALSG